MLRILDARTSPIRLLGLAAVATLMLSAGTAQRAEAMTPINPTPLPAAKAASDDMITQVRHGGGGGGHGGGFHGGGGFRGGGFHGGGGHIGGFRGGGLRGSHRRARRAGLSPWGCAGGFRHYGGFASATGYCRQHYGYRHFHRRYYYGGYYPYYNYPRRCRVVDLLRSAPRLPVASLALSVPLLVIAIEMKRAPRRRPSSCGLEPILQLPRRRLPPRQVLELPLLDHRRRPAAELRGLLDLGLGDDGQGRCASPSAGASPRRSDRPYSGLLAMRLCPRETPSRGRSVARLPINGWPLFYA